MLGKAVLSAASVLAIAILLGLVGTVWQAQRANQERTKSISAELEKKEAIWDKNKTVLELELANAKVKQVAGQAKVAEVMRVTVVSKSIKAELPMESALLAIEAVRLKKKPPPQQLTCHMII